MIAVLLTAAQVREHYPSLSGTGEDARVEAIIPRVEGLVAAYLGLPAADSGVHTLDDTTYTRHLEADATDARRLRLGVRPVVSITSLHVDPLWVYGSDTAYTSGTDFVLDAAEGALYALPSGTLGEFSAELRANRAVVVAGFASGPPALLAVLALAVRDVLDRGKTGDQLSASTSRQNFSRGQATHLLSEAVRTSLDPWVDWGARVG